MLQSIILNEYLKIWQHWNPSNNRSPSTPSTLLLPPQDCLSNNIAKAGPVVISPYPPAPIAVGQPQPNYSPSIAASPRGVNDDSSATPPAFFSSNYTVKELVQHGSSTCPAQNLTPLPRLHRNGSCSKTDLTYLLTTLPPGVQRRSLRFAGRISGGQGRMSMSTSPW